MAYFFAMSRRTTVWILTAAIAIFAGNSLPVFRAGSGQAGRRIVWCEEIQRELPAHFKLKAADRSLTKNPDAAPNTPPVSLPHFAPLDNRPPPPSALL
jgi:hypothetical protein